MSKKFNVDEQKQLFEPIEITIESKTYILEKVTVDLMDKVVELSNSKENDTPLKQLALLLNTEADEFKAVDVRKISKVLQFITESIKEGMGAVNPTVAEAKQ